MFNTLKEKLKKLKLRAESLNEIKEELPFDMIEITEGEEGLRIEIKDYITCSLYTKLMEIIDLNKVGDNISFNIMWNGQCQKINRGFYYIVQGDNLYNFLIDGNNLTIDERIKVDDIIEEKIIRYNFDSGEYRYSSLKHDKSGSTFFVKFYNKNGTRLDNFALDKDVAFQELSQVLNNLEGLEVVKRLFNVDEVKNGILGDFGLDFLGASKKKK